MSAWTLHLSCIDEAGNTTGVQWVLHPGSYEAALAALTDWLGPPHASAMATAESNEASSKARGDGFVVVTRDD